VNSIVVHYQELALKGKNRPWFLGRLVRHLRHAVSDLDVTAVRALMGRIEVVLGPTAPLEAVSDRIRHTFGVANFSLAGRSTLDIESMAQTILRDLGDRSCRTFRVSARRADKRFPMTSPQIEREVGGRIKEVKGWTVDLEDPELDIRLELLTDQAFYFFGKDRGPGGLPTGTAGRVACLLSGGIDSPVAAHRMMKRGCTVTFVHFHSYPFLSRASQDKARQLARHLCRFQLNAKLLLVPFGEIQRQVTLSVPSALRVIVYRRLMMRIAERVALRLGAHGLVTGDVVGQVASQTLENMSVTGAAVHQPVFRPLVGMDKDEITGQAERLGTYAISIQPDEDCCTLFTPRHPVTRARANEIDAAERSLPIEAFVETALQASVVERFTWPTITSPVALGS
jgi:thiamine biosynthesis protein ThiI